MFKKLTVIFTIILSSFIGLFACSDPYKDISLKLSSKDATLEQGVELLLEEDLDGTYKSNEVKITAVVEGAGSGVSDEVILPNDTLNNKFVGIKDVKKEGNVTTFVLYGKERGKTKLEFRAEGVESQKIDVNVGIGIKDFAFKENAFRAIAEGDSVDFGVNLRSYITFNPGNTSQDEIDFSLENVNGAGEGVCAKIENNVLKTVKGAVYPTNGSGVKVLTIRATSRSNPSLTDTFDIPVLSITDKLMLTTNNYGQTPTIELTKNSAGKYELVMTPLLATSVETPDLQYFMSNRELTLMVGDNEQEHNKYLITCTMPQNEYLTVTRITDSTVNANYTNYQIIANKVSAEPILLTFDIDYVGSTAENPTGDINKYKGLFTRKVEIEVLVTSLPSAETISVNNSYDSEITLDVYDYYYGIDGTYLKISEKLTDLNLTYSIKYFAEGYGESISKETLSIYTNGQFVDEDHIFHNNDILYLKHYYPSINIERKPYLEVTFNYTFLPEGSQDQGYDVFTITKKINLNFFEGIKEVTIQDLNLEVVNREKVVLYTFPAQMNAKQNVKSITSSNNDLFEISYDKNIVYIQANDDMQCGLVTGLKLTTTNGAMSNLATVRVYMESMYDQSSQLYYTLSGKAGDVFYAGVPADGEKFVGGYETATILDNDGNEYRYQYFNTLVLKTNTDYTLDVYHLFARENALNYVFKNMDVVLSGTQSGVLEWNQEDGKLSTFDEITGQEPLQVTITLRGYDEGANPFFVTNTINVYVFEPLIDAQLDVAYKEISLSNNIGLYDQLANEDKFMASVATYSSNGFVENEERITTFGNLEMRVEISSAQLEKVLYEKNGITITLEDLINGIVNESIEITEESAHFVYLGFRHYILVNEGENVWTERGILSASEEDAVFKKIFGDGLKVTGSVIYSQFGRDKNMPFELDLIYREKVKNIVTNINTSTGIDFEFKGGETPDVYTISYTVFPQNAFNKNFNIIVKDADGKEIHALVDGKCNICDCPFKDITYKNQAICHKNGNNHASDIECKGAGINITTTNEKIRFEITNEELIGKINVYLVPHDSYKPQFKVVEDVRTLASYTYTHATHFVIHVTNGTLDAPFQIRDERDFMVMLSDIKNGLNQFNYNQVNDINLSNYELFDRVKDIEFKGSYNGAFETASGNKVYTLISGVKLVGTVKTDSNIGLFGKLIGENAKLQYVNVHNAVVDITTSGNVSANIGVLAGSVGENAQIQSSRVSTNSFTVDNTANSNNARLYIGTMAGQVEGKITGNYLAIGVASLNNATVNASVAMRLGVKENDIVYAGGVAGHVSGEITDQDVSANITYSSNAKVLGGTGGVVGSATGAKITNVNVVPYLIARANVGGVVGLSEDTQITGASVIMTFNSVMKNVIAGSDYVGGIAGRLTGGSVTYSYVQSLSSLDTNETFDYTGEEYCGNVVVYGDDGAYLGGIVGYVHSGDVTLNAVMFKGDLVSYNESAKVSGIANYNDSVANMTLTDFMIIGDIIVPENVDYNMIMTSTKEKLAELTVENHANAEIGKGYSLVNGFYGTTISGSKSQFGYIVDEQVYNFSDFGATNGIVGTQDGEIVKDTNAVAIYQYNGDETYTQLTNWLINPNINGGLPVLVRLNTSGDNPKLDALFSSVATLSATVLQYEPVEQKPVDVETQGHIKIDDTNLVLYYNRPIAGSSDDELNKYYLEVVDDKGVLKHEQDIIQLTFSALDMSGTIVDVNLLKDYRLTSSSGILSIGNQVEVYGTPRYELFTSGVGTATLTFTNVYDESNVIAINVEVINGLNNFVVYDVSDNMEETETLKSYVDQSSQYKIQFENIINGITYTAYNLGGFDLELKKSANSPQFKLGTQTINCSEITGDDYTKVASFDRISNISLLGLVAGSVEARLVPYIYYYGTQVRLEKLAVEREINILDKAQSLQFTSENAVTIKPEANVDDVYFELVASDMNEELYMNITENGKEIYTDLQLKNIQSQAGKTNLLYMTVEKVGDPTLIEGTTLYKVLYRVSLKMDKQAYFEIIAQNKHENPLRRPVSYEITFYADSNHSAKDTYTFTIEPNELENIRVGLYPKVEYDAVEGEWEIDTTSSVTDKLAPNQTGLLQINTLRDFNNVAYIELTTTGGSHVSLQQLRQNANKANNISYVSLDNNAIVINNGLRLWNVSNNSTDFPFNSTYYVLLSVDETIKQGNTLKVYVNAFDHNGKLMDVSAVYDIAIENLPSVNIKVNGLVEDVLPVNEYIPLEITSEHIDKVTYRLKSTGAAGITPGTYGLYTFDGENYVEYANTELDMTQKYYLFISENLRDYNKIKIVVTGEKFVNGFNITDEATLTVEPTLFVIEDVSIDGTIAENTLFLYTSTFATLGAKVVMNDNAMKVVEEYYFKDGEFYKYNESEVVTRKLTTYQKDVIKRYQTLNAIISGKEKQSGTAFEFNYWNVKGETSYRNMTDGEKYNNNFRFYKHTDDETKNVSYRVEAIGIATSEIRFDAKFYYSDGEIYFVDTTETISIMYTGKAIMHDFKLTVLDNSSRDNPNPIFTQEDLTKLKVDPTNTDEDGNIVRPHYILMNDLTLTNWKPIEFDASSFDGNSYVITIESFDFSDFKTGSSAKAGLFTSISQYSVMKNVTIDISKLLITDETGKSNIDFTTQYDSEGGETFAGKTNVEFGLITPENNGSITNTKVVNMDENKKGGILHINTPQGSLNSTLCTALVSPFVVTNKGTITYSYVGTPADGDGKISCGNSEKEALVTKEVFDFKVYGGNNIAGFVQSNSGLITASYVHAVSIKNLTNVNKNSSLGGFVGKNNGRIYSSFVATDSIEGHRPKVDAHFLEGKGHIGGFVYENATNGTIENCYSIMLIINSSVETGGFVYANGGSIKNAYTTTIPKLDTSDTFSDAHGWFVGDKAGQGKLENCYYFLKNREIGLDVDIKFNEYYYDDNILKLIDPATPIFDLSDSGSGSTEDGYKDHFNEKDSFDGFVFEGTNSIWEMNGQPVLKDCLVETKVYRVLSGIKDKDGKDISLDEFDKLPEDVVYNYTYRDTQYGTKENPIVINAATEFLEEMVGKSKVYDKLTGEVVFGLKEIGGTPDGSEGTDDSFRVVRLINDLDFTNVALNNLYTITSGEKTLKHKISDVIFAGVLEGNGMKLSGIKLNNTSEQIIDDYGLFKQIGLSQEQQEKLGKVIESPQIYNINISYDEVKYKNARKVGVLAGSIYDATIYTVNIEGKKESVSVENSTIIGQNLVGGLAGFIGGENTNISFVTLKNIKVKATHNPTANITNEHEDLYGFYNAYTLNGDVQKVVKSQKAKFVGSTKLDNLSNLSYAGGVAGLVNISNNVEELEEPRDKFDFDNYYSANKDRKIHSLTVADNIDIRGDQAGGIFGGLYDSSLQLSKIVLMDGNNTDSSYQTIFGYNYAGGIVGELENSVLDQVTVEHDHEKQLEIDNSLATKDSVSKDDLFKVSDPVALNVSIAIGGIAGYSKESAIIFSASKVNVTNKNAKIAGGLVGYAEDYNYMAYSFTTGSVIANEVFGGLVGFYLNSGYDYYLLNTYASNVWTKDVMDVLKVNTHAIQPDGLFKDIRMAEIGNMLARRTDGELVKKTNNISEAVFAEPQKFVYAGSVMGKVTLKEGTYTLGGDKITVTDKGLYYVGDTEPEENNLSVKNLFVYQKTDSEPNICNDGAKPIAVALFDITSTAMKLTQREDMTDNARSTYYKYFNNYVSEVYSTVYSKVTFNGNIENGNRSTIISSDSAKLIKDVPDKVGEEETSDEITAKNIRYDNVFGNQYYVSYITGDYYVSDVNAKNYASFDNAFEKFALLPNGEENYDHGGSVKPSNIWYVVNNSILPSYMVGKNAKLKFIESTYTSSLPTDLAKLFDRTKYPESEELVAAFESGNQTVRLGNGRYFLHLDGTNVFRFNKTFSGSVTGAVDGDGNNLSTITVLYYVKDSIARNSMLFKFLQGATFTNVNIELIIQSESIWSAGESDGYFGLIAPKIENVKFDNCDFNIKYANENAVNLLMNNSKEIHDGVSYYIINRAGLVFGRVYNSQIHNSSFVLDNGVRTKGKTNSSLLVKLGGFACEVDATAIKEFSHGIMGENLNMSEYDNSLTVLGGLFASVTNKNTDISGIHQVTTTKTVEDKEEIVVLHPITFSRVKEKTNNLVAFGGLIGEQTGGFLDNVDLGFTWDVEINSTAKDLNFGGIAGKIADTEISNIFLGGKFITNIDEKTEEESTEIVYELNTELKLTVDAKNINYGGLVGYMQNSHLVGKQEKGKYVINNTNIILNNTSKANVNIGGLVGLAKTSSTSNSEMRYVINSGDVTISDTQTNTLNAGGLIGSVVSSNRTGLNISSAYSTGDINDNSAADKTRLGGVIGHASIGTGTTPTISNVTTYGDIIYGKNEKNINASGVVGYSETNVYTLENVFTFTQIRPLSTSGWNINRTTASPFTSNSEKMVVKNCLFINEHYLNIADSESAYSDSGVWLYDLYEEFNSEDYELYKVFIPVTKGELAPDTVLPVLPEEAMLLTQAYWQDNMPAVAYYLDNEVSYTLSSDFVDITDAKYQIHYLSKDTDRVLLNTEVQGYNIALGNLVINEPTSIVLNAILTGPKSTTGYKTISFVENGKLDYNNGCISNFAVNHVNNKNTTTNFMTTNCGYVYNVVVYGEEKDVLVDGYASFAGTNNGLITQSGVNITYTNVSGSAETINFSGFVSENAGQIKNSYAINNILYCDKYEKLSSAGIATENSGKIDNVFVGGKFTNTELKTTVNVAGENSGTIGEYFVDTESVNGKHGSFATLTGVDDEGSMYQIFNSAKHVTYNEDGKVASTDYIWNSNNRFQNVNNKLGLNYHINSGFPYINGGIIIPTYTQYIGSELSFYKSKSELVTGQNTLVMTSLRDFVVWANVSDSNSTSTFNVYFTQNIDAKEFEVETSIYSIQEGYTLYGNGLTLSNFTIETTALFAYNNGTIQNLTLGADSLTSITVNAKTNSNAALLVSENNGVIEDITVNYFTVATENLGQFGVIATVNNASIIDVKVNNFDIKTVKFNAFGGIAANNKGEVLGTIDEGLGTIIDYSGEIIKIADTGLGGGGISYLNSGIISNCEVKNLNIETSGNNIKTSESKVSLGGIAAATDSGASVTNCKVISSTINGINNVGGLIGKISTDKIVDISNSVVQDSTVIGNNYVGGLIGGLGTAESGSTGGSSEPSYNYYCITCGIVINSATCPNDSSHLVMSIMSLRSGVSAFNDSGAKVTGTTVKFGGFVEDEHQGWFGDKEDKYSIGRFQGTDLSTIASVFAEGGYAGKYRRDFSDENIITYIDEWYGPTNGASGNDKVKDKFHNENYDNWKGGTDDSNYYTTLGCADGSTPDLSVGNLQNLFKTARGFNSSPGKYNVGLLYGFDISSFNAKMENSSIGSSTGAEDYTGKVLLDAFTHWFYITIESDGGASGDLQGLMVLEFRQYYDPESLTPQAIDFIDCMTKIMNKDTKSDYYKSLLEINFAYDYRSGKPTSFDAKPYAKLFVTNENTGSGTYYTISDKYEDLNLLFKGLPSIGYESPTEEQLLRGYGPGLIKKFIMNAFNIVYDWNDEYRYGEGSYNEIPCLDIVTDSAVFAGKYLIETSVLESLFGKQLSQQSTYYSYITFDGSGSVYSVPYSEERKTGMGGVNNFKVQYEIGYGNYSYVNTILTDVGDGVINLRFTGNDFAVDTYVKRSSDGRVFELYRDKECTQKIQDLRKASLTDSPRI